MSETYGHAKLTIEEMHSNKTEAKAAGHLYYFTGKPMHTVENWEEITTIGDN